MKKDGFRFHSLRNAGEKDFQPKKIFSRRVRRLRRDDIGKEKGSGLQFWNLLQFFRKGRRGAICWRRYGGGGGGGGCVPEIDPGVAPSAIALLTCGLLIPTTRHPQKA